MTSSQSGGFCSTKGDLNSLLKLKLNYNINEVMSVRSPGVIKC